MRGRASDDRDRRRAKQVRRFPLGAEAGPATPRGHSLRECGSL